MPRASCIGDRTCLVMFYGVCHMSYEAQSLFHGLDVGTCLVGDTAYAVGPGIRAMGHTALAEAVQHG